MSDAGMEYDGMYWHYIDKWIFALIRLAQARGQPPDKAIMLIKDVHEGFLSRDANGKPQGIRWKVNTDLSPIKGLEHSHPNSDALNALLVYTLANHKGALDKEIAELRPVVASYVKTGMRATADPLGWGLEWWTSQWLQGPEIDVLKVSCRV